VGAGTTTFDVTNDQGLTIANGVAITVLTAPVTLLTDDFSSSTVDPTKWRLDSTPMTDTGTLTADSSIFITNNMVEVFVNTDVADWPGLALFTKDSFTASALSPVDFEIDRTKMESVLVGGNTTKEQTGIWIKDSTSNYIFFSDYDTHDGTAGGWQYNTVIGGTNDTPVPAVGKVIPALAPAALNDLGNHHIHVQVNGTAANLFLDGILGATVPFPFSQGIVFGFGAYANFSNNAGNIVRGYFDNALVQGHGAAPPQLGRLTVVQTGGNIVISWTGAGILQSSASLPGGWTDVSPPPTGTSYTVTPTAQKQQFYRLRQ
jgi:hypothetical protein